MQIILQQRQPLFTGVLDPGSHFGYYPVHFVALCSTGNLELPLLRLQVPLVFRRLIIRCGRLAKALRPFLARMQNSKYLYFITFYTIWNDIWEARYYELARARDPARSADFRIIAEISNGIEYTFRNLLGCTGTILRYIAPDLNETIACLVISRTPSPPP